MTRHDGAMTHRGGARDPARRSSPPTCPPTAGARSPTSTTPASPTRMRSGSRRWPCSRRRTASTPPPSRRCCAWRTTSSPWRAGSLDAPTGSPGRHLRRHRVDPPRRARRPGGTARSTHREHGPADHGARRLPQGRAVPRGAGGRRRRRPATRCAPTRAPWPGHRRVHRARRGLRSVLRPRRRRPGRPSRRGRGGTRRPVPRRRLHRRLGPAPPRPTSSPWTFAVEGVTSVCVDLHKYAYTPQGRLGPAPPLGRPAPGPPLRVGRRGPATRCSTRRCSRRRSGGPLAAAWAVDHHIGLDGYATLARRLARPPSTSRPRWPASRAFAAPAGFDPPGVGHRRARATSSPSPTRCSRAGGTSSRRCLRQRPPGHAPPHPVGRHGTVGPRAGRRPRRLRRRGREPRVRCRSTPGRGALLASLDPATLDDAGFARPARRRRPGGRRRPTMRCLSRMAPVNALLDALPTGSAGGPAPRRPRPPVARPSGT